MTAAALARLCRRVVGVAVLVAACGVWEVWARSESSFLLPPASVVAERAWEVWPTGEFLSTVAASLRRLAVGYTVGAGAGIGAGLLMGSSHGVRRTLEPLVESLRTLPPIAIVPAVIVVLGPDDAMQVAVISFGVCFPVLVNTLDGVRDIPPETRDTAAMLQVGPVDRTLRVYVPAALPAIAAGLRVALPIGLVMVVIAEFAGGSDGLGSYILVQQSEFDIPEMYSGILFLGLLGWSLNQAFLLAERHVLAWHQGAIGEPV